MKSGPRSHRRPVSVLLQLGQSLEKPGKGLVVLSLPWKAWDFVHRVGGVGGPRTLLHRVMTLQLKWLLLCQSTPFSCLS